MFCSFYLILYIIWFQFSLSLSPFYYFDYYEHQCFTSVLFHMFSFIKNALFWSYSWMSHRTFIESSAVTTAFWLNQYGGRFASIFRRCPPSMFWGQCSTPSRWDLAASWPENMGGSWSKVACGNVQIVNNVLYFKLKFSSIYIHLFVIPNQLLCCGVSSINHDKM